LVTEAKRSVRDEPVGNGMVEVEVGGEVEKSEESMIGTRHLEDEED